MDIDPLAAINNSVNMKDLAELIRQVEAHLLDGPRLREFLKESYVIANRYEGVRKVLEANCFFGPGEWIKYFGWAPRFEVIPEIPWDINALANPGIDGKHFLFLKLKELNGKPLNLVEINELFKHQINPKINNDASWSLMGMPIALETCEFEWCMMTVDAYKALPDEYETSSMIERVLGNMLYWLLNKIYLDYSGSSYVRDQTETGSNIAMRGINVGLGSGLRVDFTSCERKLVSGILKLPD